MNEQIGTTAETRNSLGSLFLTFLKIGSTAFGGFMALISVVQQYSVERKKLLKNEDMLDGISLAMILPGPVAVNVVAYVGYRVRGFLGAIVCTIGVILPSFLLLVILSYMYFRFSHMPMVEKSFMGFTPAVAAVILTAAWNMGTKTIKAVPDFLILLAAAAFLLGIGGFIVTLGIIAISGLIGALLFKSKEPVPIKVNATARQISGQDEKQNTKKPGVNAIAVSLPIAPLLGLTVSPVIELFITFSAMSLLLFGGGYVFIPLIQQTVVDGYGWVTRQEFVDAIAMGQVTPGPILISAAFIGYKVAGFPGATAATIGIFTPPALLMLICTRFLDRIKGSGDIKAGMRGIRAAVIGMIATAGLTVLSSTHFSVISLLIFGLTLLALLRFKVETAWVIPAAGIAGLLLY